MGELMVAAGFPAGTFSIINGKADAVEQLTTDERVKAVGFVGSTPAARSVYQKASYLGKKALCLGGAKNQVIVVPDADPAIAVPGVIGSFTGCAGQRCMAASLLIAVGQVDHIIKAIIAKASELQCGVHIGAIIDRPSLQRIEGLIEHSVTQGAKLVLDGRQPVVTDELTHGNWLAPTIIDNALPTMECSQTEIFGPVLTIIRVSSLSEAMKIEAASLYGNACSIFTTSGANAQYVADHATSGMIGINVGVPVPREPFSFGGTKLSKFGSGDITGVSSLDFWSNLKKTTAKWSSSGDKNWMG
jgi:malonate-semialdehyde dehydrogenase (acetylating)/methylmalonate-semialdehyde dehydrogenase